MFERVDEKEAYRKIRELKIPHDQNSSDPSRSSDEQIITSMCISPSEETLLAVTNCQQLFQLVFSTIDVGKVRFVQLDFSKRSFFKSLFQIRSNMLNSSI